MKDQQILDLRSLCAKKTLQEFPSQFQMIWIHENPVYTIGISSTHNEEQITNKCYWNKPLKIFINKLEMFQHVPSWWRFPFSSKVIYE